MELNQQTILMNEYIQSLLDTKQEINVILAAVLLFSEGVDSQEFLLIAESFYNSMASQDHLVKVKKPIIFFGFCNYKGSLFNDPKKRGTINTIVINEDPQIKLNITKQEKTFYKKMGRYNLKIKLFKTLINTFFDLKHK